MGFPRRDVGDSEAQRQRRAGPGGTRRGPSASVASLQRMAGNRAVAQLLRAQVDTEAPEGLSDPHPLPRGASTAGHDRARVVADPNLPGGWTAGGARITSGRVGAVDRILLEGLSGSQGKASWSEGAKARRGYAAATGPGKPGHRGRAIALVPHSMERGGGPISVVVHLHGIDINSLEGSSGMRRTGDRSEDVADFQLPQQLEAFSKNHPDVRMVILMPLGATVGGKHGYTVDFGIDSFDTFVDECLDQLGVAVDPQAPRTVYLSAHSGGGFTISALGAKPMRKYRFGGVFGFESFHGDIGAWEQLAVDHLEDDLSHLEHLRTSGGDEEKIASAQIDFLQNEGFRFAAFGGSNAGYGRRVRALRERILKWFRDRRRRLRAATGGRSDVINLLWRNYQATWAQEGHMEALSTDSHFESVLESLVGTGRRGGKGATNAPSPPAPPVSPQPSATPAAPSHREGRKQKSRPRPRAPAPAHPDHKQEAHEEHKGEPLPAAASQPAKPAQARKAGDSRSGGRSLQDPFVFEKWPLWTKPIEVIHKGTGKHAHKRAIKGIPSEFMPEILRRAKVPNPERFFDEFVSGLGFLGRPINAPIHRHLAEHLRGVEREFAEKFGGPDKDPKVAGDALGIDEDIAGARQVSATSAISMHMFGLAIDVNHNENPYLLARGDVPDAIFEDIGQLMKGQKTHFQRGDPTEDINVKFKRMTELNQMVVDYFALAEPRNEGQLVDKLKDAKGKWKGMDAQTAREEIEKDVLRLAAKLGRGEKDKIYLAGKAVRGGGVEIVRRGGLLQLKEPLVKGLKLNWGAWYGDMMHFDMRTDGNIGERISTQIFKYLGELKKQADAADPPS